MRKDDDMEFDEILENQEEIQLREQLELPDSVELLDRITEQPPVWEITESTKELAEGLELDERTAEDGEIPEISPFSYSEAYIDKNGKFHPQQITGVYKDSLKDSNALEVASELGNWGQQEKRMSCAVRTQMMIGNEGPGKNYSEQELRQIAEENKWYSDKIGTYICNIGKIAQLCYGMEREQYEGMQLDELEDLKQQGAELIVTVDQALLARPYLSKPTTPDHVVEVIGFDHSEQGVPKIIINDPGRSDGQGAAYPLDIFKRATYVTDRDTGITGIRSVTALYRGGKA